MAPPPRPPARWQLETPLPPARHAPAALTTCRSATPSPHSRPLRPPIELRPPPPRHLPPPPPPPRPPPALHPPARPAPPRPLGPPRSRQSDPPPARPPHAPLHLLLLAAAADRNLRPQLEPPTTQPPRSTCP